MNSDNVNSSGIMDIIWAPWRMAYIQENNKETEKTDVLPVLPGGDEHCFICQAAVDQAGARKRFVIGTTEHTVSLLNRFPYNNGHLLVAPRRHIARLELLTADEWRELTSELTFWVGKLESLMNADGFNVGLNLGRVAGAGLPGHLHWHIVPRWNGDTNFITTIGSTKAIPQSLESLCDLLTR